MRPDDVLGVLVALGVGGAVGAVATAVLAGKSLAASVAAFAEELEAFLTERGDAGTEKLRSAFGDVQARLAAFMSAGERLKRAFRVK